MQSKMVFVEENGEGENDFDLVNSQFTKEIVAPEIFPYTEQRLERSQARIVDVQRAFKNRVI